MDVDRERRREAYIAHEVKRGIEDLAKLREEGAEVCDLAYIEGCISEAAIRFDRENSTT